MILLINLEVKHREEREIFGENDEGGTTTAGTRSLADKVMEMFRWGSRLSQ